MKKFVLFSAALIALCACAKIAEEEISSEDLIPDGYRLVSVPVESVDTKAGTGAFTLAKGEKVSVWCTDASNSSNTGFYNFKVKSNGTTVTVQGSIPSTATVGSVALYPASSNHSYSNWHYFFSVDRKKYYVGNSYVPAEIPMYGTKNSSGKFVFTPMVGAVKKQITGIPSSVSKVKVVFTAKNVKVSGTYSVYDGSNYSTWNPVYAETDNEKQFIRYYDVVNGAVTLYMTTAPNPRARPSTRMPAWATWPSPADRSIRSLRLPFPEATTEAVPVTNWCIRITPNPVPTSRTRREACTRWSSTNITSAKAATPPPPPA